MEKKFEYRKKDERKIISSSKKEQLYDYFLVLDFEAVWNTTENWPAEIIEFPTVILNAKTLQVEGEFQRFLKPKINAKLNPYCIDVTGIQQEWVDQGISLEETLTQYDAWLREKGMISEHNPPKIAFVTCGGNCGTYLRHVIEWDLNDMLPSQSSREGIQIEPYFKNYINIKTVYEQFYQRKMKGMAGMLQELKVPLTGRHHSGIDDCRNITKIVKRMIEDGCLIQRVAMIKKKKK